MKISARNEFPGQITAILQGSVHAEVEITTTGGDKLVAIVTEASLTSLGLAVGRPVHAFVKAPWVTLLAGPPTKQVSARNQLAGKVSHIIKGAVNSEVGVQLSGGTQVYAIVTHEAVRELGLKPGVEATALIKASHVVLGARKRCL